MENLSEKKCVPCQTGAAALTASEQQSLLDQLGPTWQISAAHHLEKTYAFKNFKDALHFVNDIGHLAEAEGHHPDIHLSWGKVKIQLFTHKINGLTESDFILAAKCDAVHVGRFG